MAECDGSMLSEISKFEASSNQNHEKQTANEEVNEKVTVDEGSVINKQNENQTVVEELNWEEYPPLQRRGSSANSVGRNTSGWVDARKKPYSNRPFDFRVNVEEKSDISTEESVVSSEGCSRMQDALKKPADWPFDSAEESVASSEVCSSNGTSTKAYSRCFLVKVPRLEDELLKEQISLAELHCDEKTSSRDAIRAQIQTRIQDNEYDHAVDDVKSARELVKLKRKEIDSHLSVMRVVRNVLSFDDMDSQEAFEQQLKAEEYLKTLKKDLESLKASVLRAETAAAVAQKKNHNEERKVKELEARFRVENAACQTAYAQLRSLRTQHREKMREFFGYRDEVTAASKYAYSKNGDRLCKNRVERFMKMWNKNKEFRKDYVKSNGKSTVRRFGTLDGRSLGPDEKPVLLMMPRHVPVANMVVQKEIQEEIDQQGMSEEDVTSDEVITRKTEEEMLMEQNLEAELKEQKIEVVEANEPQMGAEVKAQMEAEKREKKRHKRLRLKERKKAARVGPSEDVDQRGKDLDSEQSTSLKTTYDDDDDDDHDHDHELNEQVLDNGTSAELAPPEKDDVEVTMQQQTPQETETREGSDQVDQVKDRREKKRQKRLRNKERKKASREVSSPSPSEVMNEESHEAKAADSNQEEEEEIKNEEEEEEREDDEVIVIEQQQPPEALMAQLRAEIKAQLEAQLRDKNRDKNLRKKKRKNAPTTTTTTNGNGRRTFLWVLIIILIILILSHPIS